MAAQVEPPPAASSPLASGKKKPKDPAKRRRRLHLHLEPAARPTPSGSGSGSSGSGTSSSSSVSLLDDDMEPEPEPEPDATQQKQTGGRQPAAAPNLPDPSPLRPGSGRSGRPLRVRPARGAPASRLGRRVARGVKFPFAWTFHRAVGLEPIDKLGILRSHLPVLYAVPEEEQPYVLHFARRHAFALRDGTVVVARQDLLTCKDSRAWFKRERRDLEGRDALPVLLTLTYTRENIRELDARAHEVFGRALKKLWDVGKALAYEELQYEKKIRGLL